MPAYQMVLALLLTFEADGASHGAGIMLNRYNGVEDCSGIAVPWYEMFPAVDTGGYGEKNCLPAVPQKAMTQKETNAKVGYNHICSGSDNKMSQGVYMSEDCSGSATASNTLADKAGWCRQLMGECVKGEVVMGPAPAGAPKVSFKLSAAMPATDWMKCCATTTTKTTQATTKAPTTTVTTVTTGITVTTATTVTTLTTVTTTTATTAAGGGKSTTPVVAAKKVSGNLKIKVPAASAATFKTNPKVKIALQEAIAGQIAGVDKQMVKILEVIDARRLSASHRLLSNATNHTTIKVKYEITLPKDMTVSKVTTAMTGSAAKTSLATLVNKELKKQNISATITVEETTAVESVPTATSAPKDAASFAQLSNMFDTVVLMGMIGAHFLL